MSSSVQAESKSALNEQVTLSKAALNPALSKSPSQGLFRSAGMMLLAGISLAGGLAGAATPALAQATPKGTEILYSRENYNEAIQIEQGAQRPGGGIKYDYTKAEVEAAIRNDVTAADLSADDFRFTALEVDEMQTSKQYHDSETLETVSEGAQMVKHKDKIMMCAKESRDGEKCQSKFPIETSHSILSCIYRNENDGQLYRVVQRSESYSQMNSMQKNVCGGHELVKDDMMWAPKQETKDGETLYLNPHNIVQIRTITDAELAKYGG